MISARITEYAGARLSSRKWKMHHFRSPESCSLYLSRSHQHGRPKDAVPMHPTVRAFLCCRRHTATTKITASQPGIFMCAIRHPELSRVHHISHNRRRCLSQQVQGACVCVCVRSSSRHLHENINIRRQKIWGADTRRVVGDIAC